MTCEDVDCSCCSYSCCCCCCCCDKAKIYFIWRRSKSVSAASLPASATSSLPLLVPRSSEHPHVFRMLFVVCAFPPPSTRLFSACLACSYVCAHVGGKGWTWRKGMGAAWAGGWLVGMSRVCDVAAGVAAAVVPLPLPLAYLFFGPTSFELVASWRLNGSKHIRDRSLHTHSPNTHTLAYTHIEPLRASADAKNTVNSFLENVWQNSLRSHVNGKEPARTNPRTVVCVRCPQTDVFFENPPKTNG